jgi:hypothetical protein
MMGTFRDDYRDDYFRDDYRDDYFRDDYRDDYSASFGFHVFASIIQTVLFILVRH